MRKQRSHTARVDPAVFQALEELLTRHLQTDGEAADTAALARLVAQNPIEQGPLEALGTTTAETDVRERLDILRRVYPALERSKNELNIGASLLPETFEIYIPMARFMVARSREIRERRGRAAVFGINGGQGSGKTTINGFLQVILSQGFGAATTGFSIDDVYKTYDQRQETGRSVHPLFAIRSVAGTHDTALAIETLDRLMYAKADTEIPIPRFDKMAKGGQGDRLPSDLWPVITGPVDIVIFEGWFVGARPQPDSALAAPVNEREAREDPEGVWRRSVNRLLATDYRELFDMLDDLFVIQVRSMEDIFRNRELQEQHLRRKLTEARDRGEDVGDLGAMSPQQVVDFISLYERTTRQMLDTLPDEARLTLYIGDRHRIERLRVNPPAIPRDAE